MRTTSKLQLRGGPTMALALQRVCGDYKLPVIAVVDDIRISFPGFDRYWMAVFFRGDFYEPELFSLFSKMPSLEKFDFIDGGANIGFWSSLLTSKQFGVRRAVAVEASPTTFANLAETARQCKGRFVALHRALTASPGIVEFEQSLRHESRHIVTPDSVSDGGLPRVSVVAETVDNIVAKYDMDSSRLLIKLDVEGAELDCVVGGMQAFQNGAIFIYEDHAKDPSSTLTAKLLAMNGVCWFITDAGELVSVSDAAAASRFKQGSIRGYNFLCMAKSQHDKKSISSRLFETA
jgi:FkbM family methyltransferase